MSPRDACRDGTRTAPAAQTRPPPGAEPTAPPGAPRPPARSYSKKEEDFGDAEEWYAYEEEREDIIERLVEGRDVPETNARIARYQQQNRAREQEEAARAVNARQDLGPGSLADAAAPADPGRDKDWWDLEAVRRIAEAAAPEDRPRLTSEAGGWDASRHKQRAEREFLCSLVV